MQLTKGTLVPVLTWCPCWYVLTMARFYMSIECLVLGLVLADTVQLYCAHFSALFTSMGKDMQYGIALVSSGGHVWF